MFVDSNKTLAEIEADIKARKDQKAKEASASKKQFKKRTRTTMVVRDEHGEAMTERIGTAEESSETEARHDEYAHLDPLEQAIMEEISRKIESETEE